VPLTELAQSVASLSVTEPSHACDPPHPQLQVYGAPLALV
jgi:hypothetical protein